MQVRIRITRPVMPAKPALGSSSLVALGILGSRLTGLVRERIIGHYFGVHSVVADAFRASVRIPYLLNNLFGEGVLSASFVTVYAKLRARHEDDAADDLACAVFSLLAVICSIAVAAGIVLAPFLIDLIAPGFHGESRILTIHLVRILFPFTGLLALSAWCLGVLNSHRRFLLSYLSPVALNMTVIVISILAGSRTTEQRLVVIVAWAFVLGSILQFLVQIPSVLKFLPDFQFLLEWHSPPIRTVIRNFGPVFISRGVVQLSSYIDSMLASFLPLGSLAAFGYAQVIALLPVSLFSMSVSAAELPALSSAVGDEQQVAAFLRQRLTAGLRRIAFFIVPSAVAFLVLGDVIAAALYQSGRFSHDDAVYLWGVLAGSSVGLLASSLGRLYSSAFYALLDTRTPLRFAMCRVAVTTVLGVVFALFLPRWLGIDQKWGVAGLTVSAGIAGWVEFALLRHALTARIGSVSLDAGFTAKLWLAAFVASAGGWFAKPLAGIDHPILRASLALPLYGCFYLAGTYLLQIPESRRVINAIPFPKSGR